MMMIACAASNGFLDGWLLMFIIEVRKEKCVFVRLSYKLYWDGRRTQTMTVIYTSAIKMDGSEESVKRGTIVSLERDWAA